MYAEGERGNFFVEFDNGGGEEMRIGLFKRKIKNERGKEGGWRWHSAVSGGDSAILIFYLFIWRLLSLYMCNFMCWKLSYFHFLFFFLWVLLVAE